MQQKSHKEPVPATPTINPRVVARRAIHEKAILWTKKPLSNLMGYFALFGFFFFFLPLCIKPLKTFFEQTPVLYQFFYFFVKTQDGGYLIVRSVCFFISLRLLAQNFYPNLYKAFWQLTPPKDEFYPKTTKEEIGFWLEVFFQVLGSSVFIYFPFGLVSYFFIR
jgi:hypothetical protein